MSMRVTAGAYTLRMNRSQGGEAVYIESLLVKLYKDLRVNKESKDACGYIQALIDQLEG